MFDWQQIERSGLEEALRQMPAAVIIVEAPSGKLTFFNRLARKMMGEEPDSSAPPEPMYLRDLHDSHSFEMLHPDGRPYELEEWPLMRSIEHGKEVNEEEGINLLADGSRHVFLCNSSPIRDDEGRIVAGVAVVYDITGQRQATEQQQRLAKIVGNSSDFIGICDLDWQVSSYVNEAGQRMVGLGGIEEAQRTRVSDYVAPEHRAFVANEMFAAVMEEGRWTGELNLRHFETGEQIPVSWDVFRIDDPTTGDPFSITTIARDITGRKRAEEALGESKRRSENILESITDAFYALDREWRFTYINERALQAMEGVKGRRLVRDELLGKNAWDEFPPAIQTIAYEKMHQARERRTAVFEYRYPDGPWFEVHAYPSEEGLSLYFRDITERKREQKELETRTHQQAAVAELGLRALANEGLQSLMDEAVALVARTLEVEYAKIVDPLRDSEAGGEGLFLRAGVGWREGLIGSIEDADLDPQSTSTLRSGEPVIVEDLSTEARFSPAPILSEHGVMSTITVVIPAETVPSEFWERTPKATGPSRRTTLTSCRP